MDSLALDSPWLEDYLASRRRRSPKTVDAWRRARRQFLGWLMTLPGNTDPFQPQYLTRTALEIYLSDLEQAGYSVSRRPRIKSAVAGFAQWLVEERNVTLRHPAPGLSEAAPGAAPTGRAGRPTARQRPVGPRFLGRLPGQ